MDIIPQSWFRQRPELPMAGHFIIYQTHVIVNVSLSGILGY